MLNYFDVIKAQSGVPVDDIWARVWAESSDVGSTVETYTGALPVTLEDTVAGSLVTYRIWGNTGGVGVKKANLAEGEQLLRNAAMANDGSIVNSSQNVAFRLIPVVEGREYTIINIYGGETSTASNFYAFFEELPQIGSVSYNGYRYSFKTPSKTFVAPINGYLATSDYYPMYDEQHSNLIPLEVYEGNASPYYLPMVSATTTENLWNEEYTDIQQTLQITYKPVYVGEGEFTLSTTMPMTTQMFTNLFVLAGRVSTGASSTVNGVWNSQSRTVTAIDGYITIAYRAPEGVDPRDYQTMLNAGTTALPYVPHRYETTSELYIGRTALVKDEYVDSGEQKIYRWAAITGLSEPLYTIENAYLTPTDPPEPLPQMPTFAGATTISYGGTGAQPEKVELKYKVKR